MKFAVVILAVVAVASAQYFPGQYNPGQYNPGQYNPGQYSQFSRKPYQFSAPTTFRPFVSTTAAPSPYFPSSVAPTYAPVPVAKVYNQDARVAQILKNENEINPDGSYKYSYETENGIAAEEQGVLRNVAGTSESAVVVQGRFSYVDPNGNTVFINYVADENGFQPSGPGLPTPHPIPEAILRSIEFNRLNSKN